MSGETQARTKSFLPATRGLLAGAALLLPSLTLLPLGGLYLWEHGLLLWWAGGALIAVLLFTLALRWLLTPASRVQPEPNVTGDATAETYWSDDEARAWQSVLAIAARVDIEKMNSREYFLELGQLTLNAVARQLHPEKTDALWQFTLPEALAIAERVSKRMGGFVSRSIPLGDTLTVAQFLAAYRWRGVFDVAERAYDIWRIVRIVNPATAVTNEARERLSRAVFNYGKEHVARRIAEAYVEEVGRAAIDLYGGRLMIAEKLAMPAGDAEDPLRELASRHIALNVAVGGGVRADRLAIASLLEDAADRAGLTTRRAPKEALTTLAVAKALAANAQDAEAAVAELMDADIIVWLLPAGSGDQDERVFSSLAAMSRAARRTVTPVLIPAALYANAEVAKADEDNVAGLVSRLAAALDARALPAVPIIALDLSPAESVEPLHQVIMERMPMARRVRILRLVAEAKQSSSWSRSARQAVKAAGALTRAVVRRR